ncbi:MAG: amino acid racemase [Candidatus Saccharibacteria bacterium]|nr:amino acid racemase [Candidatus Saccharibacteria bacterium]
MLNFPTVVHLTLPVTNFFANPEHAQKGVATIFSGIEKHSLATCDDVIIACNTAHILAEEITDKTRIKLRSLIERTHKEIVVRGHKRVGIIASPTTLKKRLFAFSGVDLVLPTTKEINTLERIIGEVINGKSTSEVKEEVEEIVSRLFSLGVDAVILGCTELEMILRDSKHTDLIKPLNLTIKSIFEGTIENAE